MLKFSLNKGLLAVFTIHTSHTKIPMKMAKPLIVRGNPLITGLEKSAKPVF
jgi:hypothetical protein